MQSTKNKPVKTTSFNVKQEVVNQFGDEQLVIGACLLAPMMDDDNCIPYVLKTLSSNDFYLPIHKIFYVAIEYLYKRSIVNKEMKADVFSVVSYLRFRKQIDKYPQIPSYATACMEICPGSRNIIAYVEPVLRAAKQRRLMRLVELMANVQLEPDFIINQTRLALDLIGHKSPSFDDLNRLFEGTK